MTCDNKCGGGCGTPNELLKDQQTGFEDAGQYLHLPKNNIVEDEIEQARRQAGQFIPSRLEPLGQLGHYPTPGQLGPFPNKLEDEGTNPKDLIGDTKPDLSLVPPAAIIYMALAMGDGARKYGPYNWREKKVRCRVYLAAAMRHIQQYLDGEECAEDSGRPHLAHAMACLGIISDAKETGNLVDDRPKTGAASALIAQHTRKKS